MSKFISLSYSSHWFSKSECYPNCVSKNNGYLTLKEVILHNRITTFKMVSVLGRIRNGFNLINDTKMIEEKMQL